MSSNAGSNGDAGSNGIDAGLVAKDVVGHLIGVIDLKDGQAVHAVAGKRENYQPTQFGFNADSGQQCGSQDHWGDAIALAQHYHSLGLRRLYVADLDAIEQQGSQARLLSQIVHACHDWDEILLDVGWTGQSDLELPQTVLESPIVGIVAATECARSADSLRRLVNTVSAQRTVLGIDYHDGRFISSAGTRQHWIEAAKELGVTRCVVLDVASVGTGNSSASRKACQITRQNFPNATIYSGGGVKSRVDVDGFMEAGCDGVMVATSLLSAK